MAIGGFHRRLREAGRRLRDRAYVPQAVLWHEGVRPGEEHEAHAARYWIDLAGGWEWRGGPGCAGDGILVSLAWPHPQCDRSRRGPRTGRRGNDFPSVNPRPVSGWRRRRRRTGRTWRRCGEPASPTGRSPSDGRSGAQHLHQLLQPHGRGGHPLPACRSPARRITVSRRHAVLPFGYKWRWRVDVASFP
jgi:hypothetical protein